MKRNWLESKRGKRDDPGSRGKPGKKGGHPEIQVNDRWLREITEDALAALEAVNEPPFLFVRGTIAARVNTELKVEALTQAALKGVLDRCADFFKLDFKKDEDDKPIEVHLPARPPANLAPDILALPDLPFPRLEGVGHVPTFLPGGTLLAVDGYDP